MMHAPIAHRPPLRRGARRVVAATAVAVAAIAMFSVPPSAAAPGVYLGPTPGVPCDKGSLPESTQGRVPLAEVTSGRAAKGYTCNARPLGEFGKVGGFQVARYVDKKGQECAYYDTTLLIGRDVTSQVPAGTGTYVMDMTDPAKPKLVNKLQTPAFNSPHESLRLNQKRGLIAAVFGTPATNVGQLDVFDVSADCRNPVLKSSTPLGGLGHESGFAPDGNTFYAASLYFRTITATDLRDPTVPKPLWQSVNEYQSHGISISDDGNRLYMAETGFNAGDFRGLTILDVSQVQKRVPNPSVPLVSRTTWPNVGTPQYAEPFTLKGRKYLMEIDEYGSGANVGAGRIIDMADEKKPVVISNLRLAVNQAQAQAGEQTKDPGASLQFQGYRAHYCSLHTRVDPTIVACSFIVSGLRVFDIADPYKPQEIAYFNGKITPSSDPIRQGAFAMSSPVYVPERRELWYSDGNLGFFTVRLTAAAKRMGAGTAGVGTRTPPRAQPPAAAPTPAPRQLPRTGLPVALPVLAVGLAVAATVLRRRRPRAG